MEELVKTFHIDIKLILAQIVNFLIVLWVLKKFAYGKIVGLLEARTKKIEQGLKDAQAATKKLEESETEKGKVIAEAKKSAQEIIAATEEQAKKLRNELNAKSEKEAEKILTDAKNRMDADRNAMMKEIREQAAELITVALEKVLEKKMDKDADKELVEKSLEEIN